MSVAVTMCDATISCDGDTVGVCFRSVDGDLVDLTMTPADAHLLVVLLRRVAGEEDARFPCKDARHRDGRCGPDGEHFKPKVSP